MRKFMFLTLVSCSLFLVLSCKSAQEKAYAEIAQLEQELWSDPAGMIDQVKADALVRAYLDYPDKFPRDEHAPNYLIKAGELMMSLKNPGQAVAIFQRMQEIYPEHPKAADALFLEAFVTENDLRNIDLARELYTRFVQDNPNHPLASDAKICIQNLGKTPEEVIREFQEMQALEGTETE